MNYNTVEEIINAGTTNMTAIRYNSKNDDGTDTLQGVSWFKFKNVVASNVYVSGNTWLGFGAQSEHLKVDRRDTAVFYVWREEGTLCNHYKFLKIRWSGYTVYSSTEAARKMTYDVILWETGDISLHMVDVPTANYDGTFQLSASTTINYPKPTVENPDITFKTQDEYNNVYIAEVGLIDLMPAIPTKFLIEENNVIYTIVSGKLVELTGAVLSASLFETDGFDESEGFDVLAGMSNPKVYKWVDNRDDPSWLPTIKVEEAALPRPQTLYTPEYDMTHPTILGVEKVKVDASENVMFGISVDHGTTWKMWNGTAWATLTELESGMSALTMNEMTTENWGLLMTTGHFKFRATLTQASDYVGSFIVDYLN